MQEPLLGADYDDLYNIRDEINLSPRPHLSNSTNSDNEQQQQQQQPKSNIVEFYHNRSVLITGASGFIGKVLIEKLLRTCPTLRCIFVLIRPKWNKQPSDRLRDLLKEPLFDGVRNSLERRVVLVEGDATERNLGLNQRDLLEIVNQVSVVFHSAATVKFDEPLKQSIGINIAGTKNVIELCRRLPQLAALVHVSTAYANCQHSEINEHVYQDPTQVDPEQLIQLAEWLDQDTLQELKKRLLGSKPNTYSYTKAQAENLLIKSARDLPVVICRPSIVVASWREPFAGWIDNVNGPTGILLGAGKGLIRSMFAEEKFIADLVPVDTTINLIVALGWFAHLYKSQKQQQQQQQQQLHLNTTTGPVVATSASSYLVKLATSSGSLSVASSLADECHVDCCSTAEERSLGTCDDNLSPSSSASFASSSSASHSTGAHSDGESCEDEQQQLAPTVAPAAVVGEQPKQDDENNDAPGARLESCAQSMAKEESNNNNNNNNNNDDGQDCEQDSYNRNYPKEQQQQQSEQHLLGSAPSRDVATSTATTNNLDYGYGSSRSSSDYAHSVGSSSSSSLSSSVAATSSDTKKQRALLKRGGDKTTRNVNDDTKQQKTSLSEQSEAGADRQRQCHTVTRNAEVDGKFKLFRQKLRSKMAQRELPEELADVPVFHCTSGNENPISWGQLQVMIIGFLTIFPTIKAYRYPCGSFTNNQLLDGFYRITLHYIPGYILDLCTRFSGGKPIIVKIFRKFDQAAAVLKAFTSKEWKFEYDNRLTLYSELMNDEDRRLFNCNIQQLDWKQFILNYIIGVRKFMLKEPMSNLEQARKNLRFLYYRNLSLQVLVWTVAAYYIIPSSLLTGTMKAIMGH